MDINNLVNNTNNTNNTNNNNNNNNNNNENELNKIKVAIRVRPLNSREGDQKIPWTLTKDSIGLSNNNSVNFTYDYVYGLESNTIDIYNAIAKNIVKSSLGGINGCIFAYGQTSSGKTFTMNGTESTPGIIKLSIMDVFQYINETMEEKEYLLKVSYLEIYNEEIRDLLNASNTKKKKLKIHEDIYKGVVVANLKEEIVYKPDQIFSLLSFGEERRHIGSTNMNDSSSRSHTLFRMHIQSTDKSNGTIQMSTLTLVDLAGSERVSSTGAEGVRLKEGTHINKSLMTLSTVISKLSDEKTQNQKTQNQHIPYRDSKLTRILQSSLGGNSKTAIICTITPAATHQEESISTLMFAKRAKRVKNNFKINQVADANTMIKKYELEILQLQDKLTQSEEINQKLKTTISTTIPSNQYDQDNFKLGLKRFNDAISSSSSINEQPYKKIKKRRNTLEPNYNLKSINNNNNNKKNNTNDDGEEEEDVSDNQDSDLDSDSNDDDDDEIIEPLDEETIKKIKEIDDAMGYGGRVNILKDDLDLIYDELEQNKQCIDSYREDIEKIKLKLQDKEIENQELFEIIDQWEQECKYQQEQNQELILQDQQSKQSFDKVLGFLEKSYGLAQNLEEKFHLESEKSKQQMQILADSYLELETNYQHQYEINEQSQKTIKSLSDDIENFKTLWIPVKQQVNDYFQENQNFKQYIIELEEKYNNLVDLYKSIESNYTPSPQLTNQIAQMDKTINTLETTNQQLQTQLYNLLANASQSTQKLEQQLQQSQQTIDQLNKDIISYTEQIEQLSNEKQQLSNDSIESKQQLLLKSKELEQLLSEALNQKEKLEMVQQLESLKLDNEQSIIQLKSQLEQSQSESVSVKQSFNEMESALHLAQAENQRLLQQIQVFTTTLQEIKSMFTTIQEQKETIQSEFNQRLQSWNSDSIKYQEIIKTLESSSQSQLESFELKKSEFTEMESQFSSLLTNYNQLFSKYNECVATNEVQSMEFQSQLKDSAATIQMLQSIEKSLQQETDKLQQQSKQLQQQLQVIESAKQEEIKSIQLELESKKSELLKLSCQFAEQTKQVTQLLVTVDQNKVSQSKFETIINEQKDEIAGYKLKAMEIAALKEENNSLKDQLKKVSKPDREKENQRKELDKYKEKLNTQDSKLSKITQDKSVLQSEKHALEKEIKDLKRTHEQTERELDKLKKTHLAADIKAKEFSALNKSVESLNKTQESLKATIAELESELSKKKQEIEKRQEEQSALTLDRDDKAKKLTQLESDYSVSTIKLENYESQFTQLTSEIIELKNKLEELQRESIANQSEHDEKLKESITIIEKVTNEKLELDQQLSSLQSEYEKSKIDWTVTSKEAIEKIQSLLDSLSAKEKEQQTTAEQLRQMTDQFNLKTWEYNDLNSQCEQLSKTLQNAKLEIEQQENSINTLDSTSSSKIKSLETEISQLVDTHRLEILDLTRENSRLSEKHNLQEQDNIQLNERILQILHQKSKQETEILALESNILDMENQNKELRSSIETIQQEFEIERNYHKGLNESNTSNIKTITEELNQFKQSNQQLTLKISKLEQTSQQQLQQSQQVQQQLQQTQQQLQQAQQQLLVQQPPPPQIDDQEKQQLLQKIKLLEKELENSKQETLVVTQKTNYLTDQFKLKESEYLDTITDYVGKEKEFERYKLSLKSSANKIQSLQEMIKKLQQEQPQPNVIVPKSTSIQTLNQNGQPIKSILKKPNQRLVIIPREQQQLQQQQQQDQKQKELTLSTLNGTNNNSSSNSSSDSLSASSTLTNLQAISKFVGKRSEQAPILENDSSLSSSLNIQSSEQQLPNKKVRLVIKQGNNTPTNNLITTSTTSSKLKSNLITNKENNNNNINQ